MSATEDYGLSKERKRVLSIYEEIRNQIPEYSAGEIPVNEPCDLKKIGLLTEELRSEAYLYYTSEAELNELMSIANDLVFRINLAKYDPQSTFFIVDSILDSIWHQKKSEELSDTNKRTLTKLAINILNQSNEKYWIESLSPSESNFNHCIYFIFMLEDRFRIENEEFEAVYNHLFKYIEKYGQDHHLSQRWLKRRSKLNEK